MEVDGARATARRHEPGRQAAGGHGFQSHGRRMSTDYGLPCDVAVRIPRSSYSTLALPLDETVFS
jgi:hypothetical protein